MSNNALTKKPEWKALAQHAAQSKNLPILSLFDKDPKRFDQFHCEYDGLLLDYSKQAITSDTMQLLTALTQACDLEIWRDRMFSGEPINNTEDRAVLHTVLRAKSPPKEAKSAFTRMKKLSDEIRAGAATDVVNIGIGGSALGPMMVCEALQSFADGPNVHFVTNIDGAHLFSTLKDLNKDTTRFIIASKTFATQETMTNARSAKEWAGGAENFIAVTADAKAAQDFGIEDQSILPLWDWVGGRYSLWSAIGLSVCISVGFARFEELLAGARSMDKHFQTAPLGQNLPVLMGLLGVWQRNFCDANALAILPYAQDLHAFPAWVQQLDMESNGKSIDRDGHIADYQTGPVVFGEPGTNGQHAFYQLLHQGTQIIPCEFIVPIVINGSPQEHQNILLAHALGQSEALMRGQNADNPHQHFSGNRPSSTIMIKTLDSYHLGMLLALYEHKIFVQGIIWNLNSFDQWGVELGKSLAQKILSAIETRTPTGCDSSTDNLIRALLK